MPLDLIRLLESWPASATLLFCDEAGAPPILEALSAVSGPWAVLTGPEGGFDEKERTMIRPPALCPSLVRAFSAPTPLAALLGILRTPDTPLRSGSTRDLAEAQRGKG